MRDYVVSDSRIEDIATYYGVEHQSDKAQEELYELSIALAAVPEDFSKDDILGEMADVTIMVQQLLRLYGFSAGEFNSMIEYKISRQMRRIGEENAEECRCVQFK